MKINFELLVKNIVQSLVMHPDDVVTKTIETNDRDEKIMIHVLVHSDDIGRVIGKSGRIANSIRTLVYAGASKEGVKVSIEFDSF